MKRAPRVLFSCACVCARRDLVSVSLLIIATWATRSSITRALCVIIRVEEVCIAAECVRCCRDFEAGFVDCVVRGFVSHVYG